MTITILDGGMGQELIARSNQEPTGLWSLKTMMESPELVSSVHRDYFQAGADIATTNSYIIHHDRIAGFDLEGQFETLHKTACTLAVKARDEHGSGLVAGSLGPTGRSYRPDLAQEIDEAAQTYAEIAMLQANYVDLHLLETMSSLKQAEGAVMGASASGKPVWLSVSVDDDDGSKLRSGEAVVDILPLLDKYDIAALLINCSIPEAVTTALTSIGNQSTPLGAYANGFTKITDDFKQQGATVSSLQARTDLDANAYAEFAQTWQADGATIIGGCCEVGPAHIQELKRRFG